MAEVAVAEVEGGAFIALTLPDLAGAAGKVEAPSDPAPAAPPATSPEPEPEPEPESIVPGVGVTVAEETEPPSSTPVYMLVTRMCASDSDEGNEENRLQRVGCKF